MKQLRLFSILLLSLLSSTANSKTFNCTSPLTPTCQSLAGYIPANATTLGEIQSLFQVPNLLSLLGLNNLPLNTLPSLPIPNGTTIYVPFPCRCRPDGTGVSDKVPIYTVRPTDSGLDAIARYTFDQFVTYPEIAAVNPIKDVNNITQGETMWIPLPCSCDRVGGEDVMHLGHIVAAGSSVAEIAAKFGSTEKALLSLNGMSDPKKLQAGQVLDVPLKACSSPILSKSLDYGLRLPALPNSTYAVTAGNCIQCSCSSASDNKLSCKPIQGLSNAQCPVAKCENGMFIGNSTSQGCKLSTCDYQGYTWSPGLNILSGLTQSNCNNGAPAPEPAAGNSPPGGISPPSGNFGGRLRAQGNGIGLLLLIQVALFWFSF